MNKSGALPYQTMLEMMASETINGAKKENVNPASLDLSLSDEIYRVEGIFLPHPGEEIVSLMDKIQHSKHDFAYPLDQDVTYLARLNETIALPDDVYGFCNPKSSTGRIDVHVRVLANGVSRYDVVPKGYKGPLWLAINPRSFPVKISVGDKLTQLRLFNKDTRLDEKELEEVMNKEPLIYDSEGLPIGYERLKIKDGDGSIILRLDLEQEIVGYECFGSNRVMDFSKRKFYLADEFFRKIRMEGDHVYLKRGGFYILSTKEAVVVPPSFACEMAPMDARSGEFRSHYAGFIDPGWGYGKDGEIKGRPLTLEVRPFEDMVVRHKQVIAKIKYERMMELPDVIYDAIATSNYITQSKAKLSKHFAE